MISGSTDAKALAAKGVHIWDANGSREFLDNLGFTDRKEGRLIFCNSCGNASMSHHHASTYVEVRYQEMFLHSAVCDVISN